MLYLQIRGREAEHYDQALDLINRAERRAGPGRVRRRGPRSGSSRTVRDPGGRDGGLRRHGVRGNSAGEVSDGIQQPACARPRAAGAAGEDRQGVLPGQVRGDPGRVAGADGEQPLEVLRMRALSGGAGLLGGRAGLHRETQRQVGRGAVSAADRGGSGSMRPGRGRPATPMRAI